MRYCFGISIILCFYVYINAEYQQDRAQLQYCNEKYITNCSVFTGRLSRHGPYLTNMTAAILSNWGNNITVVLTFEFDNGLTFKMSYKVCEAFKTKWIIDFLHTFSNIGTTCPVVAKTYWFYNMEIPPKNLPVPTSQGDYTITLALVLTQNAEKIAWGHMTVVADKKKQKFKPK